MKAIAIKFVTHDVPELAALQDAKVYQLRVKLNSSEILDRAEKNWLAHAVNHNSFFKRAVPLRGWRFDFSDVLKTYVVKQYGTWTEYNAPDKTSLRNILHGRIEQIVETTKNKIGKP